MAKAIKQRFDEAHEKVKRREALDQKLAHRYADDPLQKMMWAGCLRWAMSERDVLDAFAKASGISLVRPLTPIEKMIDAATGHDIATAEKFLDWFEENIWGVE